jgi:hypothetical protein
MFWPKKYIALYLLLGYQDTGLYSPCQGLCGRFFGRFFWRALLFLFCFFSGGRGWTGEHLIDDAVFASLVGFEVLIPIHIFVDLLERLAGKVCHHLLQLILDIDDFPGIDLDITSSAATTAPWLMDHDFCVWQGIAFTFGAGSKQNGRHTSG